MAANTAIKVTRKGDRFVIDSPQDLKPRKALIMQLAPEDRKAAAFGTYYLFRDSIIALAAGAGALLWAIGPAVNLWCAFGFGLVGTLWFWRNGRSD